jgi:hypothetical protein
MLHLILQALLMVIKFWVMLLKTDNSILLLKTNKNWVSLYCFLVHIIDIHPVR